MVFLHSYPRHRGFSSFIIHGIIVSYPLSSMASLIFIHYHSWHHGFSSMIIRGIMAIMIIHIMKAQIKDEIPMESHAL